MAKDALTEPGASDQHPAHLKSSLDAKEPRFIPYNPGNPNDTLREQFFLNIYVQRIFACEDDPLVRRQVILERLDAAIKQRDTWRNAYHAEQLLVGLMDRDKLILEAEQRLCEAERQSITGAVEHRAELAELKQTEFADENRLRNLVLRIVSQNQWRRTRQFLERRFAAAYVNRINFIWILCTLCFLFSFFIVDVLPNWLFAQERPAPVYIAPAELQQTTAPSRMLRPEDAPLLIQDKVDLPNLSGLWLALFTGLLGAAFSMIAMAQRRLEKISLEELQLQSRWEFLLLRLGFGSGAAVILYFAFQSRLVEGVLFPDLTQIGVLENDPKTGTPWGSWVPNASLAALMVWSFVAGFSENFVPNFLRKVEKPGGAPREV